jgi:hypothetical protein
MVRCPNCGRITEGDYCRWCGYPIVGGGRREVEVVLKEKPSPAKYVLPIVFLSLIVIGLVVWLVMLGGEAQAINTRLAAIEADLAQTKTDLSATQTTLAQTQATLEQAQADLATAQADLSEAQQQLLVAQETLAGLGITLSASAECQDVRLVDNPLATNPSWAQLMTFLLQDQTETHTYIRNVYDCSQFSRDVHNNAERAGIRAAEVAVQFQGEIVGHALNAFLTTDYGLVYVDCTQPPDMIARVKVGKRYRAVETNRISELNIRDDSWWDSLIGYYYMPSRTGSELVTSGIEIYW